MAAEKTFSVIVYKHIDFQGDWKTSVGTKNAELAGVEYVESEEDPAEQENNDPVEVYADASNDSATVDSEEYVDIIVLANDSGDGIEVDSYSQPVNGTVTKLNEVLTYESDSDYSGLDSFTYTIVDQYGNEDVATVTITVMPVAEDDFFEVASEHNEKLTGDSNNVEDNDLGDELEIVSVTQPEHGEVELQEDGDIYYTSDDDYEGEDSFTYTIEDEAGNRATATVYLNVEH